MIYQPIISIYDHNNAGLEQTRENIKPVSYPEGEGGQAMA